MPDYVMTPSGIEITYTPGDEKQKRMYELRDGNGEWDGEPDLGWFEVPSVTDVLNVLNKPQLIWWGQQVGAEGARWLLEHGYPLADLSTEEIVELLKIHKLTTNDVANKAGDRGIAVHDAFEAWAASGVMPDPSIYPPEQKGYVRGLVKFLKQADPEPLAAEIMVGSLQYGYAGRYDARLRIREEVEIVYKRTPKRGDHLARLSGGVVLCDLKTSKGVYPGHARQLEAYELASIESGYGASDARGILHVTTDGGYQFVRSWARADDFLAVLEVWKSEQRMKERKKNAK